MDRTFSEELPGYLKQKVVVVLTFTRIIKSVVTGQAPVTLELRNTPGAKHTNKPKVVHAYIAADAKFMPPTTRNM